MSGDNCSKVGGRSVAVEGYGQNTENERNEEFRHFCVEDCHMAHHAEAVRALCDHRATDVGANNMTATPMEASFL